MESRLVQGLVMAIKKQQECGERKFRKRTHNEDPKLTKIRNVRARRKAIHNVEQGHGAKRIGESIFKEMGL